MAIQGLLKTLGMGNKREKRWNAQKSKKERRTGTETNENKFRPEGMTAARFAD
jgi:hypothetical protein